MSQGKIQMHKFILMKVHWTQKLNISLFKVSFFDETNWDTKFLRTVTK